MTTHEIDTEPGRGRAPALLLVATAISLAAFGAAAAFSYLAPAAGDGAASPSVDRVVAVQAQPSEAELAQAASGIIETFEVFGAKNPFERPLAVEAPPFAGDLPPEDGEAPDPGDTGDGGAPPPTTEFAPERGTRVQLREIYDIESGTVATIVVDGTAYEEVGEGETFASTFQVVSLDVGTGCGTFLMGDVDFDLCVGQEILK